MQRRLISSGSTFEAEIGYSRAVVQGDWVFVSGTTGFDYATMTIAEEIESQTEQCLKNIDSALAQQEPASRTLFASTTSCPSAASSRSVGPYCASTWAR